jgi:hypothetical protein
VKVAPRSGTRWAPFAVRFAVLLALTLAPWPGWGLLASTLYCQVANTTVAPLVSPAGAKLLFRPGDDPSQGEESVPWQVYVYVERAETGEVNRYFYRWRMAYVSVATFLALAGASLLERRATSRLWAIGLPVLLVLVAVDDANRALLTIDRWRWVSLGPVTEVVLSAGYTLLNGLPVIPYVVPAILWLALVGPRRGVVGVLPVQSRARHL